MSTHISRAYQRELSEIQGRIVAMGSRCEQLLSMASEALGERDADLAAEVEKADRLIDSAEMEIDELALRVLARRQPAARDLRFLVFALKVVTDLERIGDEAANVAERAAQLTEMGFEVSRMQPRLQKMAALTRELVHGALDAFVEEDLLLAREVRRRDDEVDALYVEVKRACTAHIADHPESVEQALCLASTATYLERIADHAAAIADLVVFMASGEDVRREATET